MTQELHIGGIHRICGIQGEQTEKGGIHCRWTKMCGINSKNCSIICTQALNGSIHRICGIQGKQTENGGIHNKRTHNR